MKKMLISVLGLILFIIPPAFSAEIEPKATEVDIYPSGSRLLMDFQVERDFIIELPGTFNRESIFIIRDKSIPLDEFTVTEETRTGWIPPSLKAMDTQIKDLQSEKANLESELAGLTQTKLYLDKLKLESIEQDGFLKFLEELQVKRSSVEGAINDTRISLEQIKKEIRILVDEFNSKMPQDRNRLIVLKGHSDKTGNLRISAWTNHSRWSPLYEMNLDTSGRSVHSQLEGHVTQKSGIDWNGNLRFHSVQPQRSISTPEARPLIVDFRPDARRFDMVMSENMQKTGKAAMAPQEISFTETMTDLAIPASGRVPGTGDIAEIDLGEQAIPVNVDIVALPYLSAETWVVAKTSALDSPIIPGRVKLFLDGESSGITSINEFARGEEFTMAFGRSPMIKAKREKIVPKKGANWIGKGTLEEGYTITVVNGMRTKEEVTVIDRFPLSVQDKIEVLLSEIVPEEYERSDENMLTWNLSLEPGETQKIRVLYRIKYPSDKEIIFNQN